MDLNLLKTIFKIIKVDLVVLKIFQNSHGSFQTVFIIRLVKKYQHTGKTERSVGSQRKDLGFSKVKDANFHMWLLDLNVKSTAYI